MKASPGFGLAFVFYRWFRYGFAYSTTVIRHAELVSASILANFAVISLVWSNRLSCCEGLLSCDCEAFATYAVFNLAEVVDVDFGRFFAGVFGSFNLDDCSWSCPWSCEEFNLFFAVFCVVAGKKHSAAFNALHLSWGEVSGDDYVLAKKFFFCEVRAKAALNNAFCACTVIKSFNIELVALWVLFSASLPSLLCKHRYLCDFCNAELNVLVEVLNREKNNKNMGVPLHSLTSFVHFGALRFGFRFAPASALAHFIRSLTVAATRPAHR